MTNYEFFYYFCKRLGSYSSESSYRSITGRLEKYFLPEFGNDTPSSVTAADINHIYDTLEAAGQANNSVYGIYGALSRFYAIAIECGETKYNPVKEARSIRPTQRIN